MGIDVYMQWDGMTEAEKQAQITGFAIDKGETGYLREAYHGQPYATRLLVPEAFEAEDAEANIPAAIMRERLPEVIKTAIRRGKKVYQEELTPRSPEVKAFTDFVNLATRKEKELGKPVKIIASY
jgi:hypothetical protein